MLTAGWKKRAHRTREITRIGHVDPLPEDCIGRLDEVNQSIAAQHEKIKPIKQRRLELRREMAAQPINKALWDRASRIEDLSNSQRESLLDLKVLFLEEYERLTDAMLDNAKYTMFWSIDSKTGSSTQIASSREESEAYKRHRFLRDELNASTIVKLRTILTTQQLEAMGGLPKARNP